MKRVLLTGGGGFLGSHVLPLLQAKGCDVFAPRRKDLNLLNWQDCMTACGRGVDTVIHLAATCGGIQFNRDHPGRLFYDNTLMGAQLMEAARAKGVSKWVGVGSVCSYPAAPEVPFREEDLFNGAPVGELAPYGHAKRNLVVQAQAYRAEYGFNAVTLLPTNLFGPNDCFDLRASHVIPALIRRMLTAKERGEPTFPVWGSGKASRDFLYVKDAARAIVMAAEQYDGAEPVNIGSGQETRISDLVETLADIMGYAGEIVYDTSKPDGQPRRVLDTTRAYRAFGFRAGMTLPAGLLLTLEWYLDNREAVEARWAA